MRDFRPLILIVGCLASAVFAGDGCAGPATAGPGPAGAGEPGASAADAPRGAPVAGARAGATLAGARCHGGVCTCRSRVGEQAEDPAPDDGHKRFEFRLGAGGGPAKLTSPTLGELDSGPGESCFYVDVVPGTTHEVSFVAREARADEGVSPVLEIAEYGPKGPWWYDVLAVKCDGPGGHCDRDAADAWSAELKTRKRGRIDPCGSSVVTHLRWDTSGGTATRDLGVFRDFSVTFTLEVKKFATQFAPGSTECVPK
jgi:hypothetical protein